MVTDMFIFCFSLFQMDMMIKMKIRGMITEDKRLDSGNLFKILMSCS